ncbi:serine/threonine-protein kinase VRK1 isoform X2 [Eurytemora carolleeae]|uniref:serine/threonine-protein kinase VRK1 isoform X2 n=1 Tax=Eurytemora carolleeae TaxID=1294199 RepID=UPI000C7801AE|nr:serine/threonine-protein kinase VRK1 isoform X2 [Eurytemora carolleeae]|eukprot:XP_023328251.1 serine/threonine-protein kinase VRK1-like isoform X2 [Eurytemora affinis]
MGPKKDGGGKKPKKTASGYRMPDHLPPGTVLVDKNKKPWTLGKSIGVGGFGEIYLAVEGKNAPTDNASHVVKIEPKENGPLFVEMHFYIQVGTADHVKSWGRPVNMPLMRAQGSHPHKDDIYRFLVIDRLGVDLDKTFQNGRNPLSDSLIGTLAVQIIDTLQYIHSRGYTHNDIKAANLLVGLNKESGKIFLVDFGLCVKYIKTTGHKEYCPDKKKEHDGTIEYLSRDAHIGCTSRRSDLEVLCYNLYHWKMGTLPWISSTANPVKVQAEKEKLMCSLPGSVSNLSKPTQNLFNYVKNLEFTAEPDYDKCRSFFSAELKQTGGKINLTASSPNKPVRTPKAPGKAGRSPKKSVVLSATEESESEDIFEPSPPKKMEGTPRGTPRSRGRGTPVSRGTPRATDPEVEKVVKAEKVVKGVKKVAAAAKKTEKKIYKEMACQTSPGFIAKAAAARKSRPTVDRLSSPSSVPKKSPKKSAVKKAATSEGETDGEFINPTPAMLAILKRKKEVEEEKAAKKRKK